MIVATLPEQAIARFPVSLGLPDASPSLLTDAAEAVRQEYRNSVRWKRLRCRGVSPVTEEPGETVFVIEVGHSIQFDWTWEGAVAFRPRDISGFRGDADITDDFLVFDEEGANASVWAGEVVEVDETTGRIFVSVPDPAHPPRTGTFFVRPFEFLAFLNAVYSEADSAGLRPVLPARLEACRGNIHPPIANAFTGGLPELSQLWRHSWGLLWGPPGTGKTHTLGQQVATCLSDASERILVVSTTNKATDTAALSIGRAAGGQSRYVQEGRILRIGKSASYHVYEADGLGDLLRGTETDFLHQISALNSQIQRAKTHEERAVLRKALQQLVRAMKDSAFNIFVSPDVRVVISTAFKAITLVTDPTIRSLLARGEAPFTTIIIDEAGLISRATAAALSLLASCRLLLVGDPKQLAPISRMSRVLPTSQATWLASSALTHLYLFNVSQVSPAVHLLREQHRMHPEISQVVSHYQYDKSLVDGLTVKARSFDLPALLLGHPRAVWYVLDEEGNDLPSIRAERGPGNRSWVRPVTRGILTKIFKDDAVRQAKGLFLSPFKAQAKDIARFFASEKLENWSASTIHSQQGAEADFVILDTVNAGSCGWPYDEWKRLVNVGISRAREFVVLLASRAEMGEPYMKPLVSKLAPRILARTSRALAWSEVPIERAFQVPAGVMTDPELIGNQLAQRKILRPVMSFEQHWLCGLNMDGKPRLVRGVAGSGKTVVLAHWLQKTVKRLADKSDARVWAVFANKSLKTSSPRRLRRRGRPRATGRHFLGSGSGSITSSTS